MHMLLTDQCRFFVLLFMFFFLTISQKALASPKVEDIHIRFTRDANIHSFKSDSLLGVFGNFEECQNAIDQQSALFKSLYNAENVSASCITDGNYKSAVTLEIRGQWIYQYPPKYLSFIPTLSPVFIETSKMQVAQWISKNEDKLKAKFAMANKKGIFIYAENRLHLKSVSVTQSSIEDCFKNLIELRRLFESLDSGFYLATCDLYTLGREYNLRNETTVTKKEFDVISARPTSVKKIPAEYGESTVIEYPYSGFSPYTGNRNVPLYNATIYKLTADHRMIEKMGINQSKNQFENEGQPKTFANIDECHDFLKKNFKENEHIMCSYELVNGEYRYTLLKIY